MFEPESANEEIHVSQEQVYFRVPTRSSRWLGEAPGESGLHTDMAIDSDQSSWSKRKVSKPSIKYWCFVT